MRLDSFRPSIIDLDYEEGMAVIRGVRARRKSPPPTVRIKKTKTKIDVAPLAVKRVKLLAYIKSLPIEERLEMLQKLKDGKEL